MLHNTPQTRRQFNQEIESAYENVRVRAALNTAIPTEFLALLSRDESPKVREAVAKNTSATQDILEDLILIGLNNFDEYLVFTIAKNPSCPQDWLLQLSDSKNHDIRAAVAANRSITLPLIEKLSKDKSFQVRVEIAVNPNTPSEIEEGLFEEKKFGTINQTMHSTSLYKK